MHPILLIMLLAGALLFYSWAKRQPPKVRNKALIIAGVVVVVVLVATGRLHPLMGAIVAGLAMLQRVFSAFQLFGSLKSLGGGAGGVAGSQSSDVATEYFHMSLDHETGEMDGEVLKGPFSGRRLNELSLQELGTLFNDVAAADQRSAAVLDAYLNRRFGTGWRDDLGGGPRPGGEMSREEAYEVLGLSTGASREEIIEAHRRLMQKMHPDRGGSTYLASQINRAKDTLLSA